MKEQNSYRHNINLLILLFFIFSFIGWAWEVVFHIAIDRAFINRGVFYGPWLPIYGSGGVLTTLLAVRLKRHPAGLFFAIVGASAVIEYAVSVVLERLTGSRWWDYSEYRFNFQGRVCLYGLLLFGVGGCFLVYRVMPVVEKRLKRLPVRVRRALCAVLVFLFLVDAALVLQSPNQGFGISIAAMR